MAGARGFLGAAFLALAAAGVASAAAIVGASENKNIGAEMGEARGFI